MDENIDVPFLWLWSCKGSSNCLNLYQAVLHVRCLPWLRSDSWSTKKWPPSCHREPESPKSPKNIEDDVISCACAVHWLGMRSSWRPNLAATTAPHGTIHGLWFLSGIVFSLLYLFSNLQSRRSPAEQASLRLILKERNTLDLIITSLPGQFVNIYSPTDSVIMALFLEPLKVVIPPD